jgi:hypothetical protein
MLSLSEMGKKNVYQGSYMLIGVFLLKKSKLIRFE